MKKQDEIMNDRWVVKETPLEVSLISMEVMDGDYWWGWILKRRRMHVKLTK